jgi:uncharacterized protein
MKHEQLILRSVERRPEGAGVDVVDLYTDAGSIHCRLHSNGASSTALLAANETAVIWVGGAGGGLSGPAGGLYPRLAEQLVLKGISSLRLDYREPNHLAACVLDSLMGASYLQTLGYQRLIMVGHSFGGAVVISAGAQSEATVGVICLASQNAGTELASDLAPRSLLLLHGEADRILSDYCSRDIYTRARQPKQMILYPGCGHSLDECRSDIDADLLGWILEIARV